MHRLLGQQQASSYSDEQNQQLVIGKNEYFERILWLVSCLSATSTAAVFLALENTFVNSWLGGTFTGFFVAFTSFWTSIALQIMMRCGGCCKKRFRGETLIVMYAVSTAFAFAGIAAQCATPNDGLVASEVVQFAGDFPVKPIVEQKRVLSGPGHAHVFPAVAVAVAAAAAAGSRRVLQIVTGRMFMTSNQHAVINHLVRRLLEGGMLSATLVSSLMATLVRVIRRFKVEKVPACDAPSWDLLSWDKRAQKGQWAVAGLSMIGAPILTALTVKACDMHMLPRFKKRAVLPNFLKGYYASEINRYLPAIEYGVFTLIAAGLALYLMTDAIELWRKCKIKLPHKYTAVLSQDASGTEETMQTRSSVKDRQRLYFSAMMMYTDFVDLIVSWTTGQERNSGIWCCC